MNKLSNTISEDLTSSFRDSSQRVHELSKDLTDEQFWTRPYSYGNSFGHLTLHLIGNLNHFIGAQIANTGYVRNRDREFSDTNPPGKAEVLAKLDQTLEMVVSAIQAQTDEDWSLETDAVASADALDVQAGAAD